MAREFAVYVNIGARVGASVASSIATVDKKFAGLNSRFKAMAAEQRAAIAGMSSSLKGAAAMAASVGLSFGVKHMLGDGEELAHEIQALRNAGRTAAEVADGLREANKAILEMPTASLTGSMKILNETTGAYGDFKHAVENLAFNSKLGDVLSNSLKVEDPAHEIGSLIKALEIRGSASNPEKYKREAESLGQAEVFYGGRLKSDDIYTFASNAPVGIKQLNERFLTKIAPALIQEMGGDKAGTGLTAFRTIISGRKITDKKQAQAWKDLGLLNDKDLIKNKQGDVTGWKDGAITDTALAYQDPLAFIEKDVLPALQKKGTDITDPIKLGQALNTLFKNTKANAFVTAISTVVDRARLHKDEGLMNGVNSLEKIYTDSVLNDPEMAKKGIAAAIGNLGSSLTLPLMKPLAQTLISVAHAMNVVSAALMDHPEAASIIAKIGAALTGLAAVRLANFVFGLSGLVRALAYLSIATPIGLAARLVAVARGLSILVASSAAASVTRLRGMAAGLLALNAVGGLPLVLSTVGGSILSFGKAALLFPVTALRAIGVALWSLAANPVGLAITAVVVALTALGVWVANNWGGLKTFFSAFGTSFMSALGPEAAGGVQKIADGVKAVWDWVNKLLGPIDESGKKWQSWGEAAGKAAAAAVTALVNLPSQIASLAEATGRAIVDGIVAGIRATGGMIGDAVGGALGKVGGWLHIGGGAPAGAAAPTVAGKRAMGGPVAKGLPYLVGERGPEIFVPDSHGSVKTNGFLGGLNGPSVDMSAVGRAADAAQRTGAAFHAALDTTTKPAVDTTALDLATKKATKLQTILASIGSSDIMVGGAIGGMGGIGGRGRAGGGGGSVAVGAFPAGSSLEEVRQYIRSKAQGIRINPNVAEAVARSEGLNKSLGAGGDGGTSDGPFQLHVGGGLGDLYQRQTGHSIHDKRFWRDQVDFALKHAKEGGWGPWHGAARIGVGRWQGIAGARAAGGGVMDGESYLVGERGPEIFTPGASGQISTHGALARLTEIGRKMGGGDGYFGSISPEKVAKLAAGGKSVTNVRGDTNVSPTFHIHEASNPRVIQAHVEAGIRDLIREMESDQRGSLSD